MFSSVNKKIGQLEHYFFDHPGYGLSVVLVVAIIPLVFIYFKLRLCLAINLYFLMLAVIIMTFRYLHNKNRCSELISFMYMTIVFPVIIYLIIDLLHKTGYITRSGAFIGFLKIYAPEFIKFTNPVPELIVYLIIVSHIVIIKLWNRLCVKCKVLDVSRHTYILSLFLLSKPLLFAMGVYSALLVYIFLHPGINYNTNLLYAGLYYWFLFDGFAWSVPLVLRFIYNED
jgi:hypothetical protein